jgi:hypothetical protein
MRNFIIFMVALSLGLSASAQDLLVKRNGEQIKVKVLKITKKRVEYVRHGTELPVYSLPISDIEYIEYPTGDRDTFGRNIEAQKATQNEPKMSHGPVPTPEGKPYVEYKPQSDAEHSPKRWHGAHTGPAIENIVVEQSSNKEIYNIGDIYNQNGIKGIVVMLSDGGRHGLIMSLDEACLAWCNLPRKQQKSVGATEQLDGTQNMKAIEKYIAENNLSWSNFPAFEWCKAKGDGWYLPSINEIWSAGTMYLGGSRVAESRRFRKNFNINIQSVGGTPLNNLMFYHSSTEDKDARYAKFSHMNSELPHIQSGYKADELFVRAFHKF